MPRQLCEKIGQKACAAGLVQGYEIKYDLDDCRKIAGLLLLFQLTRLDDKNIVPVDMKKCDDLISEVLETTGFTGAQYCYDERLDSPRGLLFVLPGARCVVKFQYTDAILAPQKIR